MFMGFLPLNIILKYMTDVSQFVEAPILNAIVLTQYLLFRCHFMDTYICFSGAKQRAKRLTKKILR
jgi:hypothetical protein